METLLTVEFLAAVFAFSCFGTAVAVRAELKSARVLTAAVYGAFPVVTAAVLLGGAALLRFEGVRDSAFVLAVITFGGTVAILAGVMRRGFTPRLPEGTAQARAWSLRKAAIATVVTGAAFGVTFLMARSAAVEALRLLSLEGERIREEVLGPAPQDADNAAQVYQQAIAALAKERDAQLLVEEAYEQVNPDYYPEYFYDEPPTEFVLDEPLRTAFARLEPVVELVLEAARRPRCRFARRDDLMPSAPISDLIALGRLLGVAEAIDLEEGRIEAAVTKVNAFFALADHVSDEPTAIHTICAQLIRSLGIDGAALVLTAEGLEERHLDALDFGRDGVAVQRLPEVLRLEESFGLRAMGSLVMRGELFLPSLGDLYLVFYLVDDAAGYRALMAEFRESCDLPVGELVQLPELKAERVLASGALTAALCPFFDDQAQSAVNSDSKALMVRAAVAGARFRLREQRFPTSGEEWKSVGVDALPTSAFTGTPVEILDTEDTWELVLETDDPESPLRVTLQF